jgi:hypothetical protein
LQTAEPLCVMQSPCRQARTQSREASLRSTGPQKLVLLPDIGIHGNSRMMMQDANNLQIADLVLD